MKILTKYILKEFLKPFLSALSVFISLVVLSETFRILNISDKAPDYMKYLVLYILCQTPFWIVQMLPISMLLGFMFTFGNLSKHSEITAIKAGGINLNKIFLPIILFALIISSLVIFFNETIIPKLNEKSDYFYRFKVLGYKQREKVLFKNLVYIGENGTKYTINNFNSQENKLTNINIDRFDTNLNLLEQTYAKNAIWANNKWVLKDGVYRTYKNNKNTFEEYFSEKNINIPETPDDFKIQNKKTDQMTIKELKLHIKKLRKNSIPTFGEESELHLKIAFGFASTIVILIGIAFSSYRIRTAKIMSFAISLLISFIYWGLVSVCLAIGENNILPPMLSAWLPNIIFLCVSFLFISKVKR